MKVLLIPQKNNYPDPRPSLDIFGQAFPYIAASLKKAGHEVYGMNVGSVWCYGSAPLMLEKMLRESIEKNKPELIGLGGLSADYGFVRDAIIFIRQIAPHIPIVCGGGIITYDTDYIFKNLHPDFAVIGEGENTIVALANCLQHGGDLSAIKNIAYWDKNEPIYTEVDHSGNNLDELPFPDYSPFEYKAFLKSLNQADNNLYAHMRHTPRIVPISMGRSCFFHCTFCCHEKGPKYRERSLDNALEEIKALYNEYKFNILFIYDELFALRKERISEFCKKVTDLKKKFQMDFDWVCGLRVSHVEKETLEEMKSAGCVFIGYGLESASQVVLKSMEKGITVEQMAKAIEVTTNLGMGVQGNFIFGDIAETQETINETKKFFDGFCNDLMVHFNYLTPYPGSKIFEYCLANGIIRDKQQYYNSIGTIGKYKVNMTQMDDKIFFKIVDDLCKINDSSMDGFIKLKETDVLTCENKGRFKNDEDAVFNLRRYLYRINVVCPHCKKPVDYLYPMRISITHQHLKLRLFCAVCHKRFIAKVPQETYLPSEAHPIEQKHSFDKINNSVQFAAPLLIEENYKGYNIVKFGENFYALAQNLRYVDFFSENIMDLLREHSYNSKCFTGSSISKVKRLVTRFYNNALQMRLLDKDNTISTLNRNLDEQVKNTSDLKRNILQREEELSYIKSKWWFRSFQKMTDILKRIRR